MKKIWFLALLTLGLSTSSFAQDLVEMAKNVSVNYRNVSLPMTYFEFSETFGKPLQINEPELSGCTANFDVGLEFSGKVANLEYFGEDNPSALFKEPFKFQDKRLKGRLWFDWQDINTLTEKVTIDGWKVEPSLTFEQFKQHFPKSAKKPIETENKGESQYAVLFGLNLGDLPENMDELAYNSHIIFTFRNNKLVGLSINRGIAC